MSIMSIITGIILIAVTLQGLGLVSILKRLTKVERELQELQKEREKFHGQ